MKLKVGINGLGRIGRNLLRALLCEEYKDHFQVVHINNLASPATASHLIKYDSVHKNFQSPISLDYSDDKLIIANQTITYTTKSSPKDIPWSNHEIDLIFECSGQFNSKTKASFHYQSYHAKNLTKLPKILISAPCEDPDQTIVYGVNEHLIKPNYQIISNASCTTNCLAVMINIINKSNPIEKATMNTVHSYTSDQRLLDSQHKDLRRARSAQLSMIPTTTGAAKMVGVVIPSLSGKIDGMAIRVPTPNVSLVDAVLVLKNPTTASNLNSLLLEASKQEKLNKVLAYNTEPLVSVDFNSSSYSCIVDSSFTKVIGGNLCRIMAWYDNETGFCHRMLDVAKLWLKVKKE